jgi:hypothetical protein
MKIGMIGIIAGLISLVLGVISRVTMIPLPVAPGGLEAEVWLNFANTCFLFSIAFLLFESNKAKK